MGYCYHGLDWEGKAYIKIEKYDVIKQLTI